MIKLFNNFSNWVSWAEMHENRELLGLQKPGVYLIGEFRNQPKSLSPILVDNIIYIGETCNQTIYKRLYQFDRSAFQGLAGHSGGHTFKYNYKIKKPPKWLFISTMAEEKNDPFSSAKIRFVERAIIHMYVSKFEKLPRCNRK